MRKTNILSFIRDDTPKPEIDRSRHVNHQLAISPDSPKQFQFNHVKIEDILFTKPEKGTSLLEQEYKRIKWYGKALNLNPEYQLPQRSQLSNLQDKKVNESWEESESKVVRQRSSKVTFVDKITNRSYDLDTGSRIIAQKCAFIENYDQCSKQSFKWKSGVFEQFKNAQLLQKRGNQYECLLKKSKDDNLKTRKKKKPQKLKLDSIKGEAKTEASIMVKSSIHYQNDLNFKIAREQIENSIRQMRTKRAISYN